MSEYRRLNHERRQLENEIAALRSQIQQITGQYQRELRNAQSTAEKRMYRLEEHLKKQHQEQLAQIATKYQEVRRQLTTLVEQQQLELQKQLEKDNQEILSRIEKVENRIAAKNQRDQLVADTNWKSMRMNWDDLIARKELLPYVAPHESVVQLADQRANDAYRMEQYQAVSAIVINTSTLIKTWEQSAEVLLEEWNGMRELCEGVLNCIRTGLNTARNQPFEYQGHKRCVNLYMYCPDEYAQLQQRLSTDCEKLLNCRGCSNEQMRLFLSELQQDQQTVEQLVHKSSLLHRSHLRRLSAETILTKGFEDRNCQLISSDYLDHNRLGAIRLLFRDRFLHDCYEVRLETQGEEHERTQLDIILYPGRVMDLTLERSRCKKMAAYAMALLRDEKHFNSPESNVRSIFINTKGQIQATLDVRYQMG